MARVRYFEFNALIGAVFDGRYKMGSLLGEGGQAGVFRAWDRVERRSVAIKVLRPDANEGASRYKRFEREAFALMQLDHPHCVRVYATGVDAELGLHYMAMELVQGQPLDLFVHFPLTLSQILHITRGVAGGLGEAHQRGIIHRDLKPENVVLTPNGREVHHRPILLDFGIAKFDEEYQMTVLTASEMVLGTVHYMSPEQAQGFPLTPGTDVYSLGVLLYEMMTSHPPFEGSPIQILRQHISSPVPPFGLKGSVAALGGLDAITRRCLAKAVEDRYPDGDWVARALEQLAEQVAAEELLSPGVALDVDVQQREVLVGFANGELELRELDDGRRRFRRRSPSAPVAVALGPLPSEFLTIDADGWLRCFSRRDGVMLWESQPFGVPLTALAVSPVGAVYAVAASDGRIKVLGASTPDALAEFRSHRGDVNRIIFDPMGCTLVSAGEDGAVLVWDVGEQQVRNRFAVEGKAATAIALDIASGLIAMGSDTGRITIGHIDGDRRPLTFFAHAAAVSAMAFLTTPSGQLDLYTAGYDGELRQWSTDDGASRAHAGLHPEGLRAARWFRDGAMIVLCDSLLLWWERNFYDEAGGTPDRYLSPRYPEGWRS